MVVIGLPGPAVAALLPRPEADAVPTPGPAPEAVPEPDGAPDVEVPADAGALIGRSYAVVAADVAGRPRAGETGRAPSGAAPRDGVPRVLSGFVVRLLVVEGGRTRDMVSPSRSLVRSAGGSVRALGRPAADRSIPEDAVPKGFVGDDTAAASSLRVADVGAERCGPEFGDPDTEGSGKDEARLDPAGPPSVVPLEGEAEDEDGGDTPGGVHDEAALAVRGSSPREPPVREPPWFPELPDPLDPLELPSTIVASPSPSAMPDRVSRSFPKDRSLPLARCAPAAAPAAVPAAASAPAAPPGASRRRPA
ncbi:hypothetical protein [Frankia sp. AiPa1]|uniref:hypothetical protein n=1 Tax=Frankia sp. AiPa1 TaxID=573492 RepID=UPI00202B0EBD|nr:hypothetical protein [Frankia sp. AiPa1]MCL9760719.1 hypothetical protein [Frankia sp. AiPa1]